jgi:chromosome segregation ATPase
MLRLKKEWRSLQDMVIKLQDESAQARRRGQDRVSVVELALAKSEAYLLSSGSDIAKARDQINILETQNRELKDNMEAITADHAAIITGLNITNTQYATKLEDKTKRITSLEEEISGLKTKMQTMVAKFSSAQEHITALRDENAYLRENVRVQEEIGNARNQNIEDGDAHMEGRRPDGQREGEFSGRDMSGDTGSKTRHLTMIIEDLFLFSKRLEDDKANDSALIQDYKNDHSNMKLALDKVTTEFEEATKRAEAAEATVNEWARQMHKLSSPHISR